MENIITHEECLGFDSSFGTCFLDNSVFCIRAGNFLQICRFKDRAIDILSSINGELTGFSSMAGSSLCHVLAYSDLIQNPMIHILDSNGIEKSSFTVTGVHGISSMTFSYDGQWLYSIGGLPSFRLSAFDWKNKEEVTALTFPQCIGTKLSVCPLKPRLIAVYGSNGLELPPVPEELQSERQSTLRFYTLQGCGSNYTFREVVSNIYDPIISFCWSPDERCECIVSTNKGQIFRIDSSSGQVISDSLDLKSLGDGDQNATAMICTSKFLIVSGTTSNLYWIPLDDLHKKDDLFILDTLAPLVFLHIMPGSNSLFFGTEKNSLICVDLDEDKQGIVDNTMINLRDAHKGPISSVCTLPRYVVTAGHDGTLRIWACTPYLGLIQTYSFGNDALTSLASSQGGSLVAVGSRSGIVRIINTQNAEEPILLFRERLHSTTVSSIAITKNYIISGSLSGTLVIQRTDPLHLFPLIGLLQIKSSIISISSPPPLGQSQQLLISTAHREVIRIDIPEEPAPNFRIGNDTLNRAMLKVSSKITTICAESQLREDQQYFYCGCEDKTMKYYCMPITTGDLDIVGVDDVECSAPDDVITGHTKAVTAVGLAPSQKFVASGCAGAMFTIRELDAATAQVQGVLMTAIHHNPFDGAISGIAFSPDGKKVFTTGYDGCINMYAMRIDPTPIVPDRDIELPQGCFKISISHVFAIDQQIDQRLPEIWDSREYMEGDDDGFQSDDGPGDEETPLIDQMKFEERKKQEADTEIFQSEMKAQLTELKNEFLKLIEENETAPELEKLKKEEFKIDVSSAERLEQLAKIRSDLVYYRRRVKNQIRSLISQFITEKSFTPFDPKLTTIFSFKSPIHYDNFPLPVQDDKMKRRFHCIAMLRRTEIAAIRYKPPPNDPNRVAPSRAQDTSLDGARYLSSRSNSLVQIMQSENEQDFIVKDNLRLLYDPFQIVTANRKITQLLIVQQMIFEEMNKFNVVFEEVLAKKQGLVQSLDEKNKRIRQLIRLLKLNPDDYVIFEPEVKDDETPESFLTVKDEEVILKKQINQNNNQQESTDVLDKDSFAERALRQMMGGNVNMNSMEEAPDDDEPERPEWMTTKKKEEMTEEEQYQVQEFDKKLKNFIEEREKRRKALNAELTKLVKGTASSIEEFDRQMASIYMQRFDCEEKVYYHELEILHLIQSLNDERKYRKELNDINEETFNQLTTQRQKNPQLQELIQLSNQMNESATGSEQSLENVKNLVKKDFHNKDCFNQLMRLYTSVSRRILPKVQSGVNIFQQFYQQPYVFTDDMNEVLQSRPPSLAESSWKKFLDYCDDKIRFTHSAAEKATEAVEMKQLVKSYEEDMSHIDSHLKELESEQSAVTDKLLNTLVDMHIPFTFRQGQVEIPADAILIDYTDVILIHKKVVEDRNQLILDAGKSKLEELDKIRQQHSAHKTLKWEIDKFKVDLENLNEEVKEYQLFRVTKLDQELIMGGGKNRNQAEVTSLNNSLQHTQKTHVIRMKRAKDNLRKLTQKVSHKKTENDKIEEEILQMQLSLKERKRIYNIQMKSSEGAAEARRRRLKQVMMVSRLKRAIQVQDSKIDELRAEVARLRKCVYTSFKDGEDFEAMVGYNT